MDTASTRGSRKRGGANRSFQRKRLPRKQDQHNAHLPRTEENPFGFDLNSRLSSNQANDSSSQGLSELQGELELHNTSNWNSEHTRLLNHGTLEEASLDPPHNDHLPEDHPLMTHKAEFERVRAERKLYWDNIADRLGKDWNDLGCMDRQRFKAEEELALKKLTDLNFGILFARFERFRRRDEDTSQASHYNISPPRDQLQPPGEYRDLDRPGSRYGYIDQATDGTLRDPRVVRWMNAQGVPKTQAGGLSENVSRRVLIRNVSYKATKHDLFAFFRDFSIENITLPYDAVASRPSGHAIVELMTVSEAERAILQLSSKRLLGREVYICFTNMATPMAEKTRQPMAYTQRNVYYPKEDRRQEHGQSVLVSSGSAGVDPNKRKRSDDFYPQTLEHRQSSTGYRTPEGYMLEPPAAPTKPRRLFRKLDGVEIPKKLKASIPFQAHELSALEMRQQYSSDVSAPIREPEGSSVKKHEKDTVVANNSHCEIHVSETAAAHPIDGPNEKERTEDDEDESEDEMFDVIMEFDDELAAQMQPGKHAQPSKGLATVHKQDHDVGGRMLKSDEGLEKHTKKGRTSTQTLENDLKPDIREGGHNTKGAHSAALLKPSVTQDSFAPTFDMAKLMRAANRGLWAEKYGDENWVDINDPRFE